METKKTTPAKRIVKTGKVYMALPDGTLTRNYVSINGTRVPVDAKKGSKVSADKVEK